MPRKGKGKADPREQGEGSGREALFQSQFLEDLRYLIETDRKIAIRLLELVDAVLRDPFTGIGKPEPVRYMGADVWSRRLTQEHRMVYMVQEGRVDFLQARFHY
jgi:toxin YoeB